MRRGERVVCQGNLLGAAAAFLRLPAARVAHQDAPHDFGGNRKKLRPVLPRQLILIEKAKVGLAHQRRRLQRVPGAFPAKKLRRLPMQFVIDDWQKRFDRPRVAFAPAMSQRVTSPWRGSTFPAAGESSGGNISITAKICSLASPPSMAERRRKIIKKDGVIGRALAHWRVGRAFVALVMKKSTAALAMLLTLPVFVQAASTIDSTNQYAWARTSAGPIGGRIMTALTPKVSLSANLSAQVTSTARTLAGSMSVAAARLTTFSIRITPLPTSE